MDLGTVGGLVLVSVLIIASILMGSSLLIFIDPASILVVLGGTAAIVVVNSPIADVKSALKAAKKLFKPEAFDQEGMVRQLEELSQKARKEGLLSLEEAASSTENVFLGRGLQMMADGHEASTVEDVLYGEIRQMKRRHKSAIGVFETVGDMAPAMGMIGTLIGLVQMLQAMEDPSAIGPAMAVALLTTFYGSIVANIFGIPMANKLSIRSSEEIAHLELISDGLLSILSGENPRFMVEKLNAALPPDQRIDTAA